jgi:hypothetical protein
MTVSCKNIGCIQTASITKERDSGSLYKEPLGLKYNQKNGILDQLKGRTKGSLRS